MGLINNTKYQFIKYFENIEEQTYRSYLRYGNFVAGLRKVPKNVFTNCQLSRLMSINTLQSISLCKPDDIYDAENTSYTVVQDILSLISASDIVYKTKNGFDDIMISATHELTSDLQLGIYFNVISDGLNTLYSDLFNVCNFDFPTQYVNIGAGTGTVITPTIPIAGVEVPINI